MSNSKDQRQSRHSKTGSFSTARLASQSPRRGGPVTRAAAAVAAASSGSEKGITNDNNSSDIINGSIEDDKGAYSTPTRSSRYSHIEPRMTRSRTRSIERSVRSRRYATRSSTANDSPVPEEEGEGDSAHSSSDDNDDHGNKKEKESAISSPQRQTRSQARSSNGRTPVKATPKKSAKSKEQKRKRGHSPTPSLSPSPSPLGLIPLHSRYRKFIHRHEIPRKLLHVSIGFVTLNFYRMGVQTTDIAPWLMGALVPIASLDVLRHKSPAINKIYIHCVGALMRETEVSGYNGTIWYLLGVYLILRFFPKDIGVMGVLLLSWCDTAASTFGRIWGRHTPQLRQGKSIAGTLAAWSAGVLSACLFWGVVARIYGPFSNDPPRPLTFTGTLYLVPAFLRNSLGWAGLSPADAKSLSVSGPLALGIMSIWTGVVAAGSELVDFFGLDDNFTIPVLSSVGLLGFLKAFGQ